MKITPFRDDENMVQQKSSTLFWGDKVTRIPFSSDYCEKNKRSSRICIIKSKDYNTKLQIFLAALVESYTSLLFIFILTFRHSFTVKEEVLKMYSLNEDKIFLIFMMLSSQLFVTVGGLISVPEL